MVRAESTDQPDSLSELVCSLCKEFYVSPRVLNCCHVFDASCLEKRANESTPNGTPTVLRCPTCSSETQLPAGGVSSLPLDVTLLQLVVDTVPVNDLSCTGCLVREIAVALCLDCNLWLCRQKLQTHAVSGSHHVLNIRFLFSYNIRSSILGCSSHTILGPQY